MIDHIHVPLSITTKDAEVFSGFVKDEIVGASDACVLLLIIRATSEFNIEATTDYLIEQTGFSYDYLMDLLDLLTDNGFIRMV